IHAKSDPSCVRVTGGGLLVGIYCECSTWLLLFVMLERSICMIHAKSDPSCVRVTSGGLLVRVYCECSTWLPLPVIGRNEASVMISVKPGPSHLPAGKLRQGDRRWV